MFDCRNLPQFSRDRSMQRLERGVIQTRWPDSVVEAFLGPPGFLVSILAAMLRGGAGGKLVGSELSVGLERLTPKLSKVAPQRIESENTEGVRHASPG